MGLSALGVSAAHRVRSLGRPERGSPEIDHIRRARQCPRGDGSIFQVDVLLLDFLLFVPLRAGVWRESAGLQSRSIDQVYFTSTGCRCSGVDSGSS
jgi:hypothetical protein